MQGQGQMENDLGKIIIDTDVIATYAGSVAVECFGIVDMAADSNVPVLGIVDEVLRGTNTVERIAASSKILEMLAKGNAVIFAATHDIELSYILESLYRNLHFEEEIDGGDVRFSYRLMEGRAMTSNAIRLLSVMGYNTNVVDSARKMAEDFTKSGEWDRI